MINMSEAITKNFKQARERYLGRFGEGSLDRVILVDPVHPDDRTMVKATNSLIIAIETNTPLPQIDEKAWKRLIF